MSRSFMIMMALLACLLLTLPACAETLSWTELSLMLPEDAMLPTAVVLTDTAALREYRITVPEELRDAVAAAMDASPDWLPGGGNAGEIAGFMADMGCAAYAELPPEMVFDDMYLWVADGVLDGADEEQRLFAYAMLYGGLRMGYEQDVHFRIGYYDRETGTLLLSEWTGVLTE